MAHKPPWKREKDKDDGGSRPGPPGLDMPVGDAFDYTRAQTEEIEVLRAIYMDDYEDVETKNAWSVSHSKVVQN